MRRTILPFPLAVATTATLAAPAEAACGRLGLACAYVELISYSVGSCHFSGTTTRYCNVTFFGEGSCNAALPGSCTATLASDVGGASKFCTLTAPADSCETGRVSSTSTVVFPSGSSATVCGNLVVNVVTPAESHPEASPRTCVRVS